jgi:hypothetical protein
VHVILVHGLGRSPVSMLGLSRHLRRAGHTTESFGYVAALEQFTRIRQRLRERLEDAARRARFAVVGHSLGGLLLRHALHGLTPAPVHFVMLATPNQPPRLARRLRRFWPFRLATGQAGQLLADPDFYAGLPPLTVPYTIVAGTAGPRGRWSPFGHEPNDWLVAVSETLVHETDRPFLLPVEHTFMMWHQDVRMIVEDALASHA